MLCVPPWKYIITDTSNPGLVVEPEFGLDPRNPGNINYIKYNKPYNLFKQLGGVNLKLLPNIIAISANDRLDYFVDNITTQNTSSSYAYSLVFQNYGGGVPQAAMILVGMPALSQLGAGVLEGYGSLTTASTIYVFASTYRTLVLP